MNSECCLKPQEKQLCTCSYEEVFHLVGRKWTVVILNLLHSYGSLGYNAMLAKISGITPKAFGDKLKALEEKGLIEKHVTEKPLRSTYSLTTEGKRLSEGLSPFFNATKELHSS